MSPAQTPDLPHPLSIPSHKKDSLISVGVESSSFLALSKESCAAFDKLECHLLDDVTKSGQCLRLTNVCRCLQDRAEKLAESFETSIDNGLAGVLAAAAKVAAEKEDRVEETRGDVLEELQKFAFQAADIGGGLKGGGEENTGITILEDLAGCLQFLLANANDTPTRVAVESRIRLLGD